MSYMQEAVFLWLLLTLRVKLCSLGMDRAVETFFSFISIGTDNLKESDHLIIPIPWEADNPALSQNIPKHPLGKFKCDSILQRSQFRPSGIRAAVTNAP